MAKYYNGKLKITYPGKIEWTSREEPMDELIFEWKEDDEMDWAGRLTQVMAMMVNQLQYHDINEFKVEKIDD